MANYSERTKIDPRRFVTFSSRYTDSQVVYYTERKLLTFTTYRKHDIPKTRRDKYAVIPKGYEYRPDLVSYEAYGTQDFWWKILEANEIKDIFDFKAGLNIRIPDVLFG